MYFEDSVKLLFADIRHQTGPEKIDERKSNQIHTKKLKKYLYHQLHVCLKLGFVSFVIRFSVMLFEFRI